MIPTTTTPAPLLEAIEAQVTLLRLMSEMQPDDQGLAASIGRENEPFGLGDASIVASDYDSRIGTARVGVMVRIRSRAILRRIRAMKVT